jgi:hypothetical protein
MLERSFAILVCSQAATAFNCSCLQIFAPNSNHIPAIAKAIANCFPLFHRDRNEAFEDFQSSKTATAFNVNWLRHCIEMFKSAQGVVGIHSLGNFLV